MRGYCKRCYYRARYNREIEILPDLPREIELPRNKRGDSELLRGVWRAMKGRCESDDPRWGGRGIRYCDDWSDYESFRKWAIETGYAQGLTIDRIDNDGPYSPKNCRWVPPGDQASNTRKNVRYTLWGETKTITEWGRDSRCAATPAALYLRVQRSGWEFEKAMTTPSRKKRKGSAT